MITGISIGSSLIVFIIETICSKEILLSICQAALRRMRREEEKEKERSE
jgi:hypothetical protein